MTKQELNSVRNLYNEISYLEKSRLNLLMAAEDLVPVRDDMPRSNEVKSRVEKIALKILELDEELESKRKLMIQAQVGLTEKIISEISNPCLQKLGILRYVECLSYKNVARRMKFSLRYVYLLHRKFLKLFTICSS